MLTFQGEHGGRPAVEAWELWDGAASENPGRWVIDGLAERFNVLIRFYGVPASLNYRGPSTLRTGSELSAASRDDPAYLAAWAEKMVALGRLEMPDDGALKDLEPLSRGQPVVRHYCRPA